MVYSGHLVIPLKAQGSAQLGVVVEAGLVLWYGIFRRHHGGGGGGGAGPGNLLKSIDRLTLLSHL